MTQQTRWERRDKKRHKARYGMKISGRSILTIPEVQHKRAKKIAEQRKANRAQ